MIEVRDFSVTYHGADAPSLTGIDIDIAPGRFTLVTGPTGSGKSTLLMGLGGILQHESSAALLGRVLFEGTPIGDIPLKHLCQRVGWVFQNPAAQICTGTPEREVAFGLENLGTPRDEMTHRIAEALSIVGLEKERHQKTHTLSGGQQQRLAIAAALALRPKVLLFDEPLSQLDPRGASELIDVLQNLKAQSKIAVVMVEHRLEGPLRIADDLVVLNQGRLAASGAPDALLEDLGALRALGIEPPPLTALFERMGRKERPLSAEEALTVVSSSSVRADLYVRFFDPIYTNKRSENERIELSVGADLCVRPPFNDKNKTSVDHKSKGAHTGAPLLRLKNVYFRYAKDAPPIFENLSLTIYRGDRIALIGANGVGKSTLLMLLTGTLTPCAGEVVHESVTDLRCGLLMQNPDVMLIADSVEEELAFYPRQQGAIAAPEAVLPILERMFLSALTERAPFSLSRGERQRTAIGSVLTGRPGLLLLDEPTTGQDRARIDQMMQLVASDCDALVFSSHDLETAAKHANRVIVLAGGRIIADGAPDGVLSDWDTLQDASIRLTETQRFLKAGALHPLKAPLAAVQP